MLQMQNCLINLRISRHSCLWYFGPFDIRQV